MFHNCIRNDVRFAKLKASYFIQFYSFEVKTNATITLIRERFDKNLPGRERQRYKMADSYPPSYCSEISH